MRWAQTSCGKNNPLLSPGGRKSVVARRFSAQRFFRTVFLLGIDHKGRLAAGAAAFLAPDFFTFLLLTGPFAEEFCGDLLTQVAPGEIAVQGL